jgi:excisionase family DNA binding protein
MASTHKGSAAMIGADLEPGYLSIVSLARYSGLSVRKLRDYLHDPVRPLPSYRVGGKVLVRRSDFDTWALQFRLVPAATTVKAVVDDIMSTLG